MGLAEDTKKLAEDIVASYDLRVKEIRKLAKDTQSMLKEFQGEQKGMAAELKKTFKQEEADRLKAEADRIKAFGSMKNEIQAEQEKRNKAVADLLEKFAKDHEDMAAELRKTLKEGEVVRLKEVLNLLQEFKTEREKMAANWQALTAAMAKRRSIKLKVETEVKARPVEEAIKEMEEKVTPETDLEEKVLEFIERHPEGVRVGDIEEPLGVPRMRLGQVAKRLLKKGDVRREGNIYFPL